MSDLQETIAFLKSIGWTVQLDKEWNKLYVHDGNAPAWRLELNGEKVASGIWNFDSTEEDAWRDWIKGQEEERYQVESHIPDYPNDLLAMLDLMKDFDYEIKHSAGGENYVCIFRRGLVAFNKAHSSSLSNALYEDYQEYVKGLQ